jgi:hypothetical protein
MGCGSAKSSQVQNNLAPGKGPLPPALASAPRGRFGSALPPLTEGRRDFARIFFANERKVFIIAKGMPSMRPLQPTLGPSSAHIGDLSEQVAEKAAMSFIETLTVQLSQVLNTTPDTNTLEALRDRAMAAMTVNVGIDFALHMQLMPLFMQPFFVVIVRGELEEVRIATYGFVAVTLQEVQGDRPEAKHTPYCVRLLSPNVLSRVRDGSEWEMEYHVRVVKCSTIQQAVESEVRLLREVTGTGKWETLHG